MYAATANIAKVTTRPKQRPSMACRVSERMATASSWRRCNACASAILRMRSAASGTMALYAAKVAGGGRGPAKDSTSNLAAKAGRESSSERVGLRVSNGKPVSLSALMGDARQEPPVTLATGPQRRVTPPRGLARSQASRIASPDSRPVLGILSSYIPVTCCQSPGYEQHRRGTTLLRRGSRLEVSFAGCP